MNILINLAGLAMIAAIAWWFRLIPGSVKKPHSRN